MKSLIFLFAFIILLTGFLVQEKQNTPVQESTERIDSLLIPDSLFEFNTTNLPPTIVNQKTKKQEPYTMRVNVFIPSNYDPAKNYPVLYMLHGWSDDQDQWNKITLGWRHDAPSVKPGRTGLHGYADEYQFIIVCPDGHFDCWYLNSPDEIKPGVHFEQFFIDELMPAIEKTYSVDTNNVFITGLSMGGFGAVSLYINHQDKIRAAGSLSGALNIDDPNLIGKIGLENLYGKGRELYKKYTPLNRVKELDPETSALIFDCGIGDSFITNNRAFADSCKANGIHHIFNERPGAHTWFYWDENIKSHFEFFSALVHATDFPGLFDKK